LLPSDRVTGPLAERHTREMKQLAEHAIGQFVQPAIDLRSNLKTAVETGLPDEGLRHYVERTGTDLAVVGTHGRTGWRRAVLGSVAERLIANLPCDVLAVRPDEIT
jgi:nucleotide-binding universal stress UspA family protein